MAFGPRRLSCLNDAARRCSLSLVCPLRKKNQYSPPPPAPGLIPPGFIPPGSIQNSGRRYIRVGGSSLGREGLKGLEGFLGREDHPFLPLAGPLIILITLITLITVPCQDSRNDGEEEGRARPTSTTTSTTTTCPDPTDTLGVSV
jgi:hypothetical protein